MPHHHVTAFLWTVARMFPNVASIDRSHWEEDMLTLKAITTFGAALAVATLGGGSASYAQSAEMSFFITSDGNGDGANFGGLEGADAHCTKLAQSAGSMLALR